MPGEPSPASRAVVVLSFGFAVVIASVLLDALYFADGVLHYKYFAAFRGSELLRARRLIRAHYIRTSLPLDFISLLPLPYALLGVAPHRSRAATISPSSTTARST